MAEAEQERGARFYLFSLLLVGFFDEAAGGKRKGEALLQEKKEGLVFFSLSLSLVLVGFDEEAKRRRGKGNGVLREKERV